MFYFYIYDFGRRVNRGEGERREIKIGVLIFFLPSFIYHTEYIIVYPYD